MTFFNFFAWMRSRCMFLFDVVDGGPYDLQLILLVGGSHQSFKASGFFVREVFTHVSSTVSEVVFLQFLEILHLCFRISDHSQITGGVFGELRRYLFEEGAPFWLDMLWPRITTDSRTHRDKQILLCCLLRQLNFD